jgi:hypothetical protein
VAVPKRQFTALHDRKLHKTKKYGMVLAVTAIVIIGMGKKSCTVSTAPAQELIFLNSVFQKS